MNALALPKLNTDFTIPQPDLGKAMLTGQAIQTGQMKNALAQREIQRDEAIHNVLSGVSSPEGITPEIQTQLMQRGGKAGLAILDNIRKMKQEDRTAADQALMHGLTVADKTLPFFSFRDYPQQRAAALKVAPHLETFYPPAETFTDETDFNKWHIYTMGIRDSLKKEPRQLNSIQQYMKDNPGATITDAEEALAKAKAKGKESGAPTKKDNQYTQTTEAFTQLYGRPPENPEEWFGFRKNFLGKGQDPEKVGRELMKAAVAAVKNSYAYKALDMTNPEDAAKAQEMVSAQIGVMAPGKGGGGKGIPKPQVNPQAKQFYETTKSQLMALPDGPDKAAKLQELDRRAAQMGIL